MSGQLQPARAAPRARVCVTGGLGFVGSHLCRALCERDYDVVCVDSLRGSYAARAGADAADELEAVRGVEVVRADIARDRLEPMLEGADAVIHLAALPGVRARHAFTELWTQNVTATGRLVAAVGRERRLLLASSSSVYGNAERLPTPEHSPTCPLNPYAVSKLAAENECLAAVRSAGSDVVVARLFAVFGPGQRPDMAFARWIDSILQRRPVPWCAEARARREFTYVADAVRGLIGALERGRAGEVYNVAGAGSTRVRDALAQIESLLGGAAGLEPRAGASEAVATAACGAKAREELGYVPAVALSEGIQRQVDAAVDSSSANVAVA